MNDELICQSSDTEEEAICQDINERSVTSSQYNSANGVVYQDDSVTASQFRDRHLEASEGYTNM